MKKKVTILMLVCIMLMQAITPVVFAFGDTPSLLYSNFENAYNEVSVSSSGLLTITNTYEGKENITVRATIITYIEKKQLFGLFWTRVNIGETDNEWVNYAFGENYSGRHTFQLTSKGTYRVVTTFIIYGRATNAEEIVCKTEFKY